MTYRVFDHTADFGIEVTADTAHELFEEAARALFDLVARGPCHGNGLARVVTVTGADHADLLVNWLRELLGLWNSEQLLVCAATVDHVDSRKIRATVTVDRFDPDRHGIENEIKAVTYHQARVAEGPGGWLARFVVDV